METTTTNQAQPISEVMNLDVARITKKVQLKIALIDAKLSQKSIECDQLTKLEKIDWQKLDDYNHEMSKLIGSKEALEEILIELSNTKLW